ncbi:MAG: DUF6706 family protein [bacterium]
MTNKEALLSMLPTDAPDNVVEKTFMDQGVEPDETYNSKNERDIDMVYVELLNFFLTHPDFNEGGLSVTLNRGQLRAEKKRILKKHDKYTGNIDGTSRW